MINKIKKGISYFRIWGNDYTFPIYASKILGYALAFLYFMYTLGDKKRTKEFNQGKNYFTKLRRNLIDRYNLPADEEFKKRFLRDHIYNFNGVKLPEVPNTYLLRMIYEDTLKVYTEYNDNYDYTIVDELDKKLPEGTYCYKGPVGEDISVKHNDVVIDAGAWIGDFAAYASKKGARSYAFEPSPSNIKYLEKTVAYNKGNGGSITIVPFGLGEKEESVDFFENDLSDNTGGNSFNIEKGAGNKTLTITTLDSWVKRNNIDRIDFIKADIEGFERYMLRGATEVLRKFQPTLSLCTYHYPEDPELLKEIILEANPNYKIIQRKMKLFAYVKK